MKKIMKAAAMLTTFLAIIPGLAGWAITALWNSILTVACGFATISFWQGVGIFLLGQILSGGFAIAMFLIGGSFHAFRHHRDNDWRGHWRNMTDEQRREFIERRRHEHFGFRNRKNDIKDAGE